MSECYHCGGDVNATRGCWCEREAFLAAERDDLREEIKQLQDQIEAQGYKRQWLNDLLTVVENENLILAAQVGRMRAYLNDIVKRADECSCDKGYPGACGCGNACGAYAEEALVGQDPTATERYVRAAIDMAEYYNLTCSGHAVFDETCEFCAVLVKYREAKAAMEGEEK